MKACESPHFYTVYYLVYIVKSDREIRSGPELRESRKFTHGSPVMRGTVSLFKRIPVILA